MASTGVGIEALAAAIIIQAVDDIRKEKPQFISGSMEKESAQATRDIIKATAKRYLLSEDCKFTCEVLEIDYNKLIRKIRLEG